MSVIVYLEIFKGLIICEYLFLILIIYCQVLFTIVYNLPSPNVGGKIVFEPNYALYNLSVGLIFLPFLYITYYCI